MSRALCWLQMGDFERGWAEYEWRLKCKEYSIPALPPARSGMAGRWTGERSCCTPTMAWAIRFSSSAMHRWSSSAAAG